MSAVSQALSWVLKPGLWKVPVTDREETVFAEPCNRLTHAPIQLSGVSFLQDTCICSCIFAGENQSSSDVTVIWPEPSIKNYPFGVDVGKTMNTQAKSSGDPHDLVSFRYTRLWGS